MSTTPDLHDLVIRTVAEYLWHENVTLVALRRVNARFYGLRKIFIGQMKVYYIVCYERCMSMEYMMATSDKKEAEAWIAERNRWGFRQQFGKLFIIRLDMFRTY